MALYFGSSEKLKIRTIDGIYIINIHSFSATANVVMLKSFDNYILTDSNGAYLTAKEDK